jgi:hypothetical protein
MAAMNPFPRALVVKISVGTIVGFAAVCCLAAESLQAADDAQDTRPPIAAKWQPVDLRFTYTPSTTYYSCDSLQWKLERIFKALGAHPKSKVTTTGCESSGPSRFAFVRFVGAVPVPASATSPTDQDSDSKQASKQELLKRLGVPPQFEKTEFQARRIHLDLARLRSAAVEPGDCELIEQLSREVLSKFGTTVVGDPPRCFPGHVPVSTPSLKLDVLIAAPDVDAPPASESK